MQSVKSSLGRAHGPFMMPSTISSKVGRICSLNVTDQYALNSFQNAIEKGQWYSKYQVKVFYSLLQKVHVQSLCEIKPILKSFSFVQRILLSTLY